MKTLEIRAAIKPLAEYAQELDGESIVLTANNQPVAVLLPLVDIDQEAEALHANPEFLEILDRARLDIAQGRIITLDEMKVALEVA